MLRNNQKNAIQVSLNNDFDSGVHFQATWIGKSCGTYSIQTIIDEYHKNKKIPIFYIIYK